MNDRYHIAAYSVIQYAYVEVIDQFLAKCFLCSFHRNYSYSENTCANSFCTYKLYCLAKSHITVSEVLKHFPQFLLMIRAKIV